MKPAYTNNVLSDQFHVLKLSFDSTSFVLQSNFGILQSALGILIQSHCLPIQKQIKQTTK